MQHLPHSGATRLLIIGGSAEASALARRIAGRPDLEAMLSLAGRTTIHIEPPIPFRIGGFGGAPGLAAYLRAQRIHVVIDASHPFAAQISANAMSACRELGLPFATFTRPPWRPTPLDHWTEVANVKEAARALGARPRRAFLTIGSRSLDAFATAPQHFYLVRAIEQPNDIASLPSHRLILARGPFSLDNEIALMREARIDAMVTKNSGGLMTEAKLHAARSLGVETIMIERPSPQAAPSFDNVDAVMAWIEAHRPRP